MDCIFCKIITGELPATKVYEDNDCLAFLDIYPVNPGHTLLIPKQHYDDLLSTPSEVVGKLYQAAQKVARGVMVGLGADAFNLGLNNGRAAGQVVFQLTYILFRVCQLMGWHCGNRMSIRKAKWPRWVKKLARRYYEQSWTTTY